MGGLFNLKTIKNNLFIIAILIILTFILTKVGMEHPILTTIIFFLLLILYYFFYKLFKTVNISQKYLKSVFDTQNNIIIVTNGKFLTDVNRSFFDFFDFKSLKEFRDKYDCICELFDNINGEKVIDKKVNGVNWVELIFSHPQIEHKVLIKLNNREYFFKVNAKKMDFDKDRQNLVVFTDITELQSYQNHLEDKVNIEIEKRIRQEQLLIQQSKMAAMGEMIGAIAHQWQQPLNGLALMIQDIEEAYKSDDINEIYIKSSVSDSMKQIDFMSNTINQFRNFFRPNKKKITFDVLDAIKDAIFIISSQLKNNRIKLSLSEDSFKIEGFANEFKQVILNIISNSKDAIISNQKSIKEIDIKIYKTDNLSVIKIRDYGGGISIDKIDKIFEPYFTTKGINGTGIGLYISKIIIEDSMGGELSFYNTNDGVEFKIEFENREKEKI